MKENAILSYLLASYLNSVGILTTKIHIFQIKNLKLLEIKQHS